MSVGATVVVVADARLFEAADLDYYIVDCACAADFCICHHDGS